MTASPTSGRIPDDVAAMMLAMAKAAHHHMYGKRTDSFDPDDMIGAALLRMVRRYPAYDPSRKNLKSWLWRQATGAFLDTLRDRSLQRGEGGREGRVNVMLSLEDQIGDDGDEARVIERIVGEPDVEIIDWISCDLVQRSLEALGQRERLAILLYVDGMTQEEIGVLMGVTNSRVSQLCKKAREKLARDPRMLAAA